MSKSKRMPRGSVVPAKTTIAGRIFVLRAHSFLRDKYISE
jgi:hypothetical protein